MSSVCEICGRKPVFGKSIVRRGMAKKRGGAGKKITGTSHRVFKPNVQRIKAITPQGRRYIFVCTKCLKANKVRKAV